MSVEAIDVRRPVRARLTEAAAAAWGAFVGALPHVLHHIGPLAGAALLAGAAGTALFGALGLVAAIPFLLRLRRRFGGWRAPAIAVVAFALMFTLSTLVVGPAIGGGGNDGPALESPSDHAQHHK